MGACLPLTVANSSNAIIRITSFDNRIIAAGINNLYRTNATLSSWENTLAVTPYYASPIEFDGDLYYCALNETTELWRVDSSFTTSTLACASIGSSFLISLVASSTHLYGLAENYLSAFNKRIIRLNAAKNAWETLYTFSGDDLDTRVSTICVHQDRLYMATFDGVLHRLNLAEDGIETVMTPSFSGYVKHLVSYAGDIYGVVFSTTELFRAQSDWVSVADCGQNINAFATCYDTLFVGCDQGFIYRLDPSMSYFIASSQMTSSVLSMTTLNNILYPGSYQDGILYEYNTIDPFFAPYPTLSVIATGVVASVSFALQNQPDSPITSALWDFGDSETSTDLEIIHDYLTTGLYVTTGTFQNIYNTAAYSFSSVEILQGGRVFYEGNGNTGGTAPVDPNAWYNTSVSVSDQGSLTRTGYRFVSWNTASDGSGTSYAPYDYVTVYSEDITLYALWQVAFIVTYHGNGSTGGTEPIDSNLYISEEWATVLDKGDLVKDTDVFFIWNTLSDGSGTSYRVGDSVYITSNVELYALWIPMGPSYWDTDLSGIATSVYGTGRTTNEMIIKGTTGVFEGWDFENTWFMNEHE